MKARWTYIHISFSIVDRTKKVQPKSCAWGVTCSWLLFCEWMRMRDVIINVTVIMIIIHLIKSNSRLICSHTMWWATHNHILKSRQTSSLQSIAAIVITESPPLPRKKVDFYQIIPYSFWFFSKNKTKNSCVFFLSPTPPYVLGTQKKTLIVFWIPPSAMSSKMPWRRFFKW